MLGIKILKMLKRAEERIDKLEIIEIKKPNKGLGLFD